MFDSIDQLEGKTLRVLFKIHCARGLPVKYVNELICRYKWIDEKNEEYQTEVNTTKSINPDFNYEKDHELFVSPYVISHIWEGALAIGVYGKMSQENLNQLLKGANKEKDKANAATTLKPPADKSSTNVAEGPPLPIHPTPTDSLTRGGESPDVEKLRIENEQQKRRIMELEEQVKRCGNPPIVKSSACCNIF